MKRLLYFLTIFVVVCVVLASSMGVNPHIGYYEIESASAHIDRASPIDNGNVMALVTYYLKASMDAWELWERYSQEGKFAVRVVIPETPSHYSNGLPVFRSKVERKEASNPLARWNLITYTDVVMPSGIDSQSVRRIYDAMESGLFGLTSSNPSAVASNIAVTMAEETAVTQLQIWRAYIEAVMYVIGLTDSLG